MIRTAIASDEAFIRDCAEQAYARYVPLMGRKPAPMLADYAAQIAAGNIHLATDETGACQGFIVFYPKGGHVLLENVAVMPAVAGRGIGKRLIAFCEAWAKVQGLQAVVLYTNEKMTDNLAIYPKLGYIETERRSENGFNRIYFSKRLA